MTWLLALTLTLGQISPVFAGGNIQSRGKFGLGVHLGYPGNGLSLNYFLTKTTAIQGDLSLWSLDGNWLGVGMRADFLWYPVRIARWGWGDLIWYWGPGANAHFVSLTGKGNKDDKASLGAELPVAIGLQFKEAPIDLNLEVVPVLNILDNKGLALGFGIAGALNARWYF